MSTEHVSPETPVSRVAIVTGGASGIGLAIAQRLASDGNAVAVFDRNADGAADAGLIDRGVRWQGGWSRGRCHRSCRNRTRCRRGQRAPRAPDHPREQCGAAVDGKVPFDRRRGLERVLDVNLTGTFHCCQVVIPGMIEEGWGRVVNISSSSAHSGQPFMAPYVAAKSAVIGLTKSLALEFGPKGITVNTIPPGFVDTPMLRDSEAKGLLGGDIEDHARSTPVRRAGRPEDIAAMCSFLCRDEAGYVTGQVLGVNGGRNT